LLIASTKSRWAFYCPTLLPPSLATTLIALLLLVPKLHLAEDKQRLLWLLFFGLLGGLLATSRLMQRIGDRVVVRDLLKTTSVQVTPTTRITARYEANPHAPRSEPGYAFRIVGPDDAIADLGKQGYVLGAPADMGRRLSSVLDVPLDDEAPGS